MGWRLGFQNLGVTGLRFSVLGFGLMVRGLGYGD